MSVEHSPFCASQESTFASLTGATTLPCDCGVLAASTPIVVPEPEPEPKVVAPPPAQPLTFSELLATNVQTPTVIVVSDAVPPLLLNPPATPASPKDPFAADPTDTPAESKVKEAVRQGKLSAPIGRDLLLKPLGADPVTKPNDIPVDSTSPLDSILDTGAPATPETPTAPDAPSTPSAETPKKKRSPRKKKETVTEPPKEPEAPKAAEAPKDETPTPSERDLFDTTAETTAESPLAEKEDKAPAVPPSKENQGHIGFPVAPSKLDAIYVGIDIGLEGYITEIGSDGTLVAFHPMPTSGGDRPVYDEPGIARIVSSWPLKAKKVCVMLEKQQTIGKIFRDGKEVKIGSKAHFKKGMGYGIMRGILAATQRFFPNALSFDEVAAKTWKKAMGISGGPPQDVKKKAITKTSGLYPGLELRPLERSPKSRVPSGDKAESVLISRYVWLMTTGALKLLAQAGEPTPDELAAREKMIEEESETANQDASSASDAPATTDEGNARWLENMTRLMTQTGESDPKGPSAPKKSARNAKPSKPTKLPKKKSKGKKPEDGSDGLKSLLSGI